MHAKRGDYKVKQTQSAAKPSDLPVYLFHQGNNFEAYRYFGSHLEEQDGQPGEPPEGFDGQTPDGERPVLPNGEVPEMPGGERPDFSDGERPEPPDGSQRTEAGSALADSGASGTYNVDTTPAA